MKKLLALLFMTVMVISLTACGGTKGYTAADLSGSPGKEESKAANETGKPAPVETPSDTSGDGAEPSGSDTRVLVAYFSATGTTKKLAEYAAVTLIADLYEIVPAEPYSTDDLNYNNSDCRANREMEDAYCRPEISGSVENMTDYETVFIGYPICRGEAPRIVSAFIESHDFSDKTVVTFCTSGSSSNNDGAIKALARGANWISGTRLDSNSTQSDIADWIGSLDLDWKQ